MRTGSYRSVDSGGARRLAADAALLGAALMLSWLEAVLPLGGWIPLPGAKLGLANLAVMAAAAMFSVADAAAVSLSRVLIAGVLFGSVSSLAFSLAGALCALGVLALLGAVHAPLSWLGVSVLCAAAHNLGQLLCAALWMHTSALFSYAPARLLLAALFGGAVGVLMNALAARLVRREAAP